MVAVIYTRFTDFEKYLPIHPRLSQAAQALEALNSRPFEAGKHPVDGDIIFINAAEYATKSVESALLEAHRDYIDVMLMLEGEERIGYCDLSAAGKVVKPYDASTDALLAEIPDAVSFVYIQAAFKRGDIAAAQKLQREAVRIIDGLIRVDVMPGEKAVLDMMGFHMGRCRKPFRQVTAEEKEYLRGKIIAQQADESVLTDGKIDLGKLQPLMYDASFHVYRVIGEVAGTAFKDGLKIKNR